MRLLLLIALPTVAFFSAMLGPASSRFRAPSAFSQSEASRGSPSHLLYDTNRQQLVLVTTPRDSGRVMVWNLTNSGWTLLPTSGLPARELGGAAYDSRRGRIALYGGIAPNNGETRRDDTWEWDGHDWKEMIDRSAGPRSHHAMVFDEARGVIVMFGGGRTSRSLETDTWEWNGSAWRRVATAGPPGLAHFAMVYDTLRKRTIVFGGFDERYKYLSDVWAWDGKSWERVVEGGPPARSHHSMAFDPRSGSIVVL